MRVGILIWLDPLFGATACDEICNILIRLVIPVGENDRADTIIVVDM